MRKPARAAAVTAAAATRTAPRRDTRYQQPVVVITRLTAVSSATARWVRMPKIASTTAPATHSSAAAAAARSVIPARCLPGTAPPAAALFPQVSVNIRRW